MRFLIVCAFFCHYNSVFAFLDHKDVGVVVLVDHLSLVLEHHRVLGDVCSRGVAGLLGVLGRALVLVPVADHAHRAERHRLAQNAHGNAFP